LSVLAVGFSIWQTEAIKKEVRKSKNGGSWLCLYLWLLLAY
jgi:hypothetical protein